ncbi:glycosyltransferase [Pseudodesulfovibrio cashew]|uniref:Glycosyltransferase n=1 Tax=Pseudodesulfovibrio cashew TaxID=2678688 RepID=A0A6I6JAF5_9BACT|nr:glycosyltransferase [Pseudodesulfovibrio cashew]QGY39675.1 glycosyltransferase [Pseudodesulfovibrio cashew]
MTEPVSVYHHTGLESSGGATRVARLLMEAQAEAGIEANLSFELGEGPDSAAILPGDFGRYLPRGAVAHVHCTGDWPALLEAIPPGRRTVITLHDCELFTGGCPYPLDCPELNAGCVPACPRKFPGAADLRKEKLRQIHRLEPALAAPSRWLARLAKTHLFRPVTVIPNGIPWPERPTSKREARSRLGINPAARVVLFTAHGATDAAYKSGNRWKSIWSALKANVPEALCFTVGGDTAGRDGDLVVWPYVRREQLALIMAASDLLLYPTKADNHSLVLLEAMAQALPAVAYGVGGVPEQITDQATGILVEPGNEHAFIQAATTLLTSGSACRELGQAAFAAGKKRFTAERMAADYLKLYRKQAD